MTVKRSREEAEVETLAMANCLMLLSKVGKMTSTTTDEETIAAKPSSSGSGRVFECKTCNKQFDSFQALGGHRASHKKLRLVAELFTQSNASHAKFKKHKCSICGLEFALGQALGGHMRRHRAEMEERGENDHHHINPTAHRHYMVPVLKRSNSKRIFGLDLNLTPYENDLNLGIKIATF